MASLFVYNDSWVNKMSDKIKKLNFEVKAGGEITNVDELRSLIGSDAAQNMTNHIEVISKALTASAVGAIDAMSSNLTEYTEKMESIYNKIKAMNEAMQAFYPTLQMGVDSLNQAGWPIGENFDPELVISCTNLPKKEIDNKLTDYYSANNYKELFDEIDIIIRMLDDGYKEQMQEIKELLKKDIKYYKVVIQALYSLIDYSYNGAFGRTKTKKYTNKFLITEDLKGAEKDKVIGMFQIVSISNFKILLDQFGQHSFAVGVDDTDFSRATIMHGRYNPERLSIKHLIQVVLLLSGVLLLKQATDSVEPSEGTELI